MRIFYKGGPWKNSEDEILKAAVMKYGKNQWSRVASLLPRKSAKQCKARWYEWLDPSIRKTEWTREEEEKLLHLAKLMPQQWRTVAPLIGRSPAQCFEHYEKLLDKAQGLDTGDRRDDPRRLRPGEVDPHVNAKPARPDPIDMDEDEKEMLSEARARLANTQGKKAKRKAREKQLNEAKRLAGLQKRRELKAAGIDIPDRKHKKKFVDYATEIPFYKEPQPGFYETAQETAAGRKRGESEFVGRTVEELEGPKRKDLEEQARKDDKQRQQKREKSNLPAVLQQMNTDNDVTRVLKRQRLTMPAPQITDADLEDMAKAGLTGGIGSSSGGFGGGGGGGGSAAASDRYDGLPTTTLLTDYKLATPSIAGIRTPGVGGGLSSATPAGMRTPMPSAGNSIMLQAQNLAILQSAPTPLVGGGDLQLNEAFSDFSGLTPAHRSLQTPNPLAAMATPRPGIAAGPLQPGSATPAAGHRSAVSTPFRDELQINDDFAIAQHQQFLATPTSSSASVRRRKPGVGVGAPSPGPPGASSSVPSSLSSSSSFLSIRNLLSSRLDSLPKPQNEYAVVQPDPEQLALLRRAALSAPVSSRIADRVDVDRERQRALTELESQLIRSQTRVVQRSLPRPPLDAVDQLRQAGALVVASAPPSSASSTDGSDNSADSTSTAASAASAAMDARVSELLRFEILRLVQHDGFFFPQPDSKDRMTNKSSSSAQQQQNRSAAATALERFTASEIDTAASLIQDEISGSLQSEGETMDSGMEVEGKSQPAGEPTPEWLEQWESLRDRFILTAPLHSLDDDSRIVRVVDTKDKTVTADDRLAGLLLEYSGLRSRLVAEQSQITKLEQKIRLKTTGYLQRYMKLVASFSESNEKVDQLATEKLIFESMQTRESECIPARINSLKFELEDLKEREKSLQSEYASLLEEYRSLSTPADATVSATA